VIHVQNSKDYLQVSNNFLQKLFLTTCIFTEKCKNYLKVIPVLLHKDYKKLKVA